ncbi:Adenylate and Guanylate cyclase catalytic domain containing protein [Trichomonas vaginalis G3]|uniref:Adenylate and Guanylate cyclase catalytic domain containing protein n=1 Tax=Trichomonas vaginalis (strain ATCC PRA-98 / G3) TaxID=412133 RepID=A2FAE9_TRIV3|nr:guanylate cyclase protein [Trichomonas vaginalis G3]EAX98121.1 Adenylate and Guanylate cyclase catalytic domain containing protein [Trichomonas vaginalis G3]KAI5531604.1 guanylate cyclase protein [Trichomonas vaginalis G3]|eukprot:XP_001311051.1 Adenylate and Guanylate cyclase catalytic domain containing protein [Trichomonas vaginalis G3]
MNPSESSVSKSTSSVSSIGVNKDSVIQGKYSLSDQIFPVYDQMMQKAILPKWFLAFVAFYIMLQILIIAFWVYTEPFLRINSKYSKFFEIFLKVFIYGDAIHYTEVKGLNMYRTLIVSLFAFFWVFFVIYYHKLKYSIPVPLLYITSLIVDILVPVFITPSAYVACHGIVNLKYAHNSTIIGEIIIGFISYGITLMNFSITTTLKARSVALTNLTFPLFDSSSIVVWTISTTLCCILSAILTYFENWTQIIVIVIHAIISCYLCYRLLFIPFYDLYRNASVLAFAITSIVLDIYSILMQLIKSIPYEYIPFILIGSLIISFIFASIFYKRKVKQIKEDLTFRTDNPKAPEYLASLNIDSTQLRAMEYIVVGLTQICDYFVDGSLTDYIIKVDEFEGILAILLQVVTFFPCESRKMDVLYKKLIMKRKLSFADRFLLYQVYRIKTRRLVTDTKSTLETYTKLKARNDECKQSIRSFWDFPSCKINYLSSLSITVNDINSLFINTIQENPNNVRIATEYSDFLIECMTNFDEAIRQKVKVERILNGTNFNVDISFRSLVNKFPRYLKDKILDTKGRLIMRLKERNSDPLNDNSSNQSKSGSSSKETNTSTLTVDLETQEVVSKRVLRDSKVRLAFHQSIHTLHPHHMKNLTILANSILVVCFSIFIAYYAYQKDKLKWRRDAFVEFRYMSLALDKTYYASFVLTLEWARMHDRYDNSTEIMGNISIDFEDNPIAKNKWEPAYETIYQTVDQAKDFLETLYQSMADSARTEDIYEIIPLLLKPRSKIYACTNYEISHDMPGNLKDQFVIIHFFQDNFAGDFHVMDKDIPNIYQNDFYCQLFANSYILSKNAEESIENILDYSVEKSQKLIDDVWLWTGIGGGIVLFVTFIPMIIIIINYYKIVNGLLKVLLELPNSAKEDAKKRLNIENTDEIVETSNKTKKSKLLEISIFIYFASAALITVLYCLSGLYTYYFNDLMANLLDWYYISCVRNVASSELRNNILHIILLNDSLPNKIIPLEDIYQAALDEIDLLKRYNQYLIEGGNNFERFIGFDAESDSYQFMEVCELGRDPKSMHDMYACSSIDKQIAFLTTNVRDIMKNPDKLSGAINDEVTQNVMHLINNHFYPLTVLAATRVKSLLQDNFDAGMKKLTIYLVIELLISLFLFILPLFIRAVIWENYKMLLMLLKHLPPQVIIDTPEILDFFREKSKHHHTEAMTISKSVVYNTSECIAITNQNAIIEIVNQSLTANINITPDQILGQSITNIISLSEHDRIGNQIQLMTTGQGSSVWQDHTKLVKDDGSEVPFGITIIGMKENEGSADITSLVFILENEEEKIKQKKLAEESKAKSEKLLYQILPKDIVVRLNRGETDISFTIPSATIFFIDIVKFSSYAELLTPSEIMANLSLVFATFDGIVSEFQSITKIKLIGDVYMAAAGLFQDPKEESKQHAEDAVRCCLKCAKSMEEINMKLNASLEVRIGCNSGGPLIGGVLGTDKPTFDIIGDTINVAARLQSTDIPGNVQISASTKEMIEHLDFVIEERGLIYLKGKGKQMTYFVSFKNNDGNKSSFDSSFTLKLN